MILFNVMGRENFPEYKGDMTYISEDIKEMVNNKFPFLTEFNAELITKSNKAWLPVASSSYQKEILKSIIKYALTTYYHELSMMTPEDKEKEKNNDALYADIFRKLYDKENEYTWEVTQKSMFDSNINMKAFINYAFTSITHIKMLEVKEGYDESHMNEEKLIEGVLNLFLFQREGAEEIIFILCPFNEAGYNIQGYTSSLELAKEIIHEKILFLTPEEEEEEMNRLEKEQEKEIFGDNANELDEEENNSVPSNMEDYVNNTLDERKEIDENVKIDEYEEDVVEKMLNTASTIEEESDDNAFGINLEEDGTVFIGIRRHGEEKAYRQIMISVTKGEIMTQIRDVKGDE